MTPRRAPPLACLLALLAGAAVAGPAPEAQLERMGQAVRGLNYQGTLVYVQGDSVETMELVHRVEGDTVRERLTTVSGARREVVCEGDKVKFFLGDERAVLVERRGGRSALPRVLPAEAATFADQYRIADQGLRSEAGRSCRSIGIVPKDALRYGYRLCLDEETGLPLRTEVLAEDGKRVIEQVVFTQVAFPARIDDAALKARSDARGWTWHVRETEPAPADVAPRVTIADLPAGFVATRDGATDGPQGEHLAFSDGLASVSVFVEPADAANKGLEGAARMGATHLFGREVGGMQITVVGEVPAATVRAIAEAIGPPAATPVDR
jgi:sigma-E factor negative regulatory protein RseB